MDLQELVAAVYTETNRPDLVNETLQSVLEATLSCHLADNWKCDLLEGEVIFNTAAYIQALDTSVIPNFRQATYLRKTDTSQSQYEADPNLIQQSSPFGARRYNFLKAIELGAILDEYGYERTDVWYQAGNQINIKSSTSLQYMMIGYYQYPVLDKTGLYFSSWIAQNLPYFIVYRACGSLFAKIGETASASMYMRPPNQSKMDEGGMYYSQLRMMINTQTIERAW